eukprot:646161-Hanusia_phi.AAC.3
MQAPAMQVRREWKGGGEGKGLEMFRSGWGGREEEEEEEELIYFRDISGKAASKSLIARSA